MNLELFFNFDGNCRDAVEFYAKVFKSEVKNLMTFGQAPPDPNFPVQEADKDKLMYADVKIGGVTVMFMDMPSGFPLVAGNNINPTISMDSKEEVERIFNELSDGGEVLAELQQTFFSELYGNVKDKFGIIWQVLYYKHEECEKKEM
jgi:PhnB protein